MSTKKGQRGAQKNRNANSRRPKKATKAKPIEPEDIDEGGDNDEDE
jgi:hypothetical protein